MSSLADCDANSKSVQRAEVVDAVSKIGCFIIFASLSGVAASAIPVSDDWDAQDTYGQFGSHGLLQMPNARFGEPGDFALGWQRIAPYRYFTINMTPFPWLEAAVRYASAEDQRYALASSIGENQSNKDKGIDVKLRLLSEDVWLPQVAVGIRDLGGTGLFGSEYVVASKRTGPFDWTLGLGWGLLGTRGHLSNPARLFGSRFDARTASTGQGGTFALNDWFSGETVSVFGGLSARTPIEGLTLKVEYDGNNYSQDWSQGARDVDSPINAGLVYRWGKNVDVHLGVERGNTLSSGISLRTHFGRSQQPVKRDPVVTVLSDSVDTPMVIERLKQAGFLVSSYEESPSQISMTGGFSRYPEMAKGLGRASQAVAQNLNDRELVITEQIYGLPLVQWSIPGSAVMSRLDGDFDAVELASSIERRDPPAETVVLKSGPWEIGYGLAPDLEQSFQSPEAPLVYRLKVTGDAELRFKESTALFAQVSASLSDNYDKLSLGTPTALEPVRTEVRQYLKENRRFGLDRLQINHFERLGTRWYAQAYLGHLEPMFSGYGSEIVYKQFDAPWALGVDLNRVWRRAFDSFAGRQTYAVTTGHLSGYYEFPDEGVVVRGSVGRYLAGDVGATLDFSRRFPSGFVVGVWATITDVSAEVFGEGSFDKGAYMRIPFDLFTLESTRAVGGISWRPMQRDGGAKLERGFDLQTMTQSRSQQSRVERWEQFGQ